MQWNQNLLAAKSVGEPRFDEHWALTVLLHQHSDLYIGDVCGSLPISKFGFLTEP